MEACEGIHYEDYRMGNPPSPNTQTYTQQTQVAMFDPADYRVDLHLEGLISWQLRHAPPAVRDSRGGAASGRSSRDTSMAGSLLRYVCVGCGKWIQGYAMEKEEV